MDPISSIQSSVFVFGSNLAGIHGTGAALYAARWCGARRGQGEGLMGVQNADLLPACYAIPTKRTPYETLPLPEVAQYVEAFKAYARDCPKLTFQITRIGCLRSGFTDAQIAPLFDDAPPNCLLPGVWLRQRDPGVARVILTGSPPPPLRAEVFEKIERLTRRLRAGAGFEVLYGATEADQEDYALAPAWARETGFSGPVTVFPVNVERFGRSALQVLRRQMTWFATHVITVRSARSSPEADPWRDVAQQEGLEIRQITF